MNDAQAADSDDAARVRRYEHPAKRRYYALWAQRDLFGQWCLMRAWGGMNSRLGRLVISPIPDLTECLALMNHEARRRGKRGYARVR